jgi:hypothetical protein
LFSGAPSVALANLMVVIAVRGHGDAIANSRGMIIGSLAFALSALVGIVLVGRFRAKMGSGLIAAVWLTIAGLGYLVVLAP